MDFLFSIYGLFGLAGVAGLAALCWFAPSVAVSIGLRILDAALLVAQYILDKLFEGGQWISKSLAATFTLIFCIVVAGVIGDKTDPLKWVTSAAWELVRPEVDHPELVARPARKQSKPRVAVKRTPLGAAWDDIKCSISGSAC